MADDDILKDAKEAFELIAEREADNRREALDDLRLVTLTAVTGGVYVNCQGNTTS